MLDNGSTTGTPHQQSSQVSYQALTDTRVNNARQAFEDMNPAASRNAHEMFTSEMSDELLAKMADHNEPTASGNRYVKPMVFGGLDGISTMFALIAGSVGAQLTLAHMVAVGVGNLVAGAFGMGFGEYVSAKAETDVAVKEQNREQWEVENYPEGEISEMVQLYRTRGISKDDAITVATTLSKYKEFWIEHMMLTELGLFPVDAEDSAAASGFAMFCSFMIFGSVPLLSYLLLIMLIKDLPVAGAFAGTVCTSLLTLFVLGVVKSKVVSQNPLKGGMYMLLQGALSAAASYWLGDLIQRALDAAGVH
ncbi:conserved hypothetical protein [Perkinsus marinus ATCC 50983]|uniref:Integral membrane protein n=1 Tax=Perkinsus marinus (strain ATCC 50983 / TXsc) TaxID=423536 RepID=C5KKF6_PERM5|nr:conserved hypothetical protein [Perkinsus marinus ATCC 50983]XP_002783272.1 conserved hypothetical protein [Perkinsus marinus ATCC 50983]EER03603.1 conserved hypothetical protein [Perkinsus marinus ATCC 50983]EER15068.1 conserved hypothetical protein [Perkinsus marinus ATCC 50983]|eukprot:XP_002771787.1 conserved hypothetical protein [Perkinsus marinus ATCC 50983]